MGWRVRARLPCMPVLLQTGHDAVCGVLASNSRPADILDSPLSLCALPRPSSLLSPCSLLQPPHHPLPLQTMIDTGKLAPYDVLIPDEELAPEEVKQTQLAASMWTASGYYHLLPWSCVVLESVPEAEVGAGEWGMRVCVWWWGGGR